MRRHGRNCQPATISCLIAGRRSTSSQSLCHRLFPPIHGDGDSRTLTDRLETASFLRSNGTFQYLTGLPGFPDPQTLRRFLLQAPDSFREQMHRVNGRLLQHFIHFPDYGSRLIFDLDGSVVTVFGRQENAAVGYNPCYRGKRRTIHCCAWKLTLPICGTPNCVPATLAHGDGSVELMATCFVNVPRDIRELRAWADAGFGFNRSWKSWKPDLRNMRLWPA